MLSHTSTTKMTLPKFAVRFGVVLASVLATGCQSLDYRQIAYGTLRHEDCRRNEVNVYCSRSYFHQEYNEYERLRREFLGRSKEIAEAAEIQVNSGPKEIGDSDTSNENTPLWVNTQEDSTEL